MKMVAGDGENRLPVQLRVIQPVQKMDPSRPGRGQAHAQLACIFRVSACHECSRFLMSDLDETDFVFALPERLHNSVNAVPRQTEDDLDAPVPNRIEQDVGARFGHS